MDRKLHHLRRIEADYRRFIQRARGEMKENTIDPVRAEVRFRRIKAKYERKIEKLQPKIKQLTNRRAELKQAKPTKS